MATIWYSQGIVVCSEIDLPTEPIHVSITPWDTHAISDLKAVLEDGDKEKIEAKTAALAEASAAVAQKLYAEQGGAEGAPEAGEAEQQQAAADDVVDAEFEEVDDDDKKSA